MPLKRNGIDSLKVNLTKDVITATKTEKKHIDNHLSM